MRKAQMIAVFSLGLFALVGACLILAQDGFTTSSKHGHWSIFVPTPQAYVMAAMMFALSMLAALWLLQQVQASRLGYALSMVAYGGTVFLMTHALAQYLQ